MKHLLDTSSLSRADAIGLLDIAEEMTQLSAREVKKLPVLRGRTVVN
ncbi:aspartate carbamoyltransferase, partial [Burkholderia multivorans]